MKELTETQIRFFAKELPFLKRAHVLFELLFSRKHAQAALQGHLPGWRVEQILRKQFPIARWIGQFGRERA